MTGPTEDLYARFLNTADTKTWRSCLDEAMTRVEGLPKGAGCTRALTEALTIAMYVHWLGTQSGESSAADYGSEKYERLKQRLTNLRAQPGDRESDTCWGLILGWSGYRLHGWERLARHGRPALEHHLVCLPSDDLQIVASLRDDFLSARAPKFLPAIGIYGAALVNIGAVAQAQGLVNGSGWPETEPLLADVLGAAAERAGNWGGAHAIYQASNWPEHRYRAALTGAIAGGEPQSLTLDQPLLDRLGTLESELNQTALIRSAAFLEACLWQSTTNWLVELEQGKLCFRRRWHAEADNHFANALAAAPEQARYPIASLRFGNLTWLRGDDKVSIVDLEPEAHTVGREALALAPGGDDKGDQSTWLASQTGDNTVLPTEFEHWPAAQRAEAWEALGDEPRAVDAHLTSLEEGFSHRTVTALVRRLARAGFSEATSYLAELVLRESEDDFFALWETAEVLQTWSGGGLPEGELGNASDGINDRFRGRLRELSLLEFKNAVRSFGLFRRAGLHDVAEELLNDAARSAESVSQLRAVAVLCRPQGPWAGQLSQLGYGCLMRAAREARDRFERLQIARELFAYGQIAAGRAVLEEERVFSPDSLLSHAEIVAVLLCSAWLTPDRVEAAAKIAIASLRRDARSGALGPDYSLYATRLRRALPITALELPAEVPDSSDEPSSDDKDEQPPNRWEATAAAMADWIEADESDGPDVAPVELNAGVPRGERLTITLHLLRLLADAQAAVRAAHPDVQPEATPVRLDLTGDGVRTVELGDLWRLRLTGSPAEQRRADEQLHGFYDEEEKIIGRWEDELREAAQDHNRQLVRICHLLSSALDVLVGPAELCSPHPVLRGLYEALDRDFQRLRREVAETAETAERDLSLTLQRLETPH